MQLPFSQNHVRQLRRVAMKTKLFTIQIYIFDFDFKSG